MAWAPDYCNLTDLQRYVSVEDSVDEEEMLLAISAASRAVDRTCNRQFGKDDVPTSRYYTARRDPSKLGQWVIPIDDVMNMTAFELALEDDNGLEGYTSPLGNYRLGPRNAPANGRPWTSIHTFGLASLSGGPVTVTENEDAVRVTALFGWDFIPAAVAQATLMQASRFLARRGAPFGIAGSPDAGSEMRLLAKVDPDVEVALAPYRRWWAAA